MSETEPKPTGRRYVLLDSKLPTLVSDDNYWAWHSQLDAKKKSCLGMKLERTNTHSAIVSTVFLGAAQGNDENGKPLLFETFVCGGKYHSWCKRYSAYEKAMKGHNIVSSRVVNDDHIARIES